MKNLVMIVVVLGLAISAAACGSDKSTVDLRDSAVDEGSSDTGTTVEPDDVRDTPDGHAGDTDVNPSVDPFEWGPYAVGYHLIETTDASRADRSVPILVYYPAGGSPTAPDAETTCGSETMSLPSQYSSLDATPEPMEGGFPVLVFSHGSGAQKEEYKYVLEFVASHGFVVVAPDHTGNTGLGSMVPDDMEMTSLRVQDVLFVLEWTRTVNAEDGNLLKGLMDTDNIAVAGHSYGGHVVMAIAGASWDFAHIADQCAMEAPPDPYVCSLQNHRDEWNAKLPAPGVKAVISMAHDASEVHFGTGCAGASTIEVPSMYMGGTDDQLAVFNTNAAECFAADTPPAMLLKLIGGGHLGFTDMLNDGSMTCERAHFIARTMTVAFLMRWLNGIQSMDSVLAGGSPGWTESGDFLTTFSP